MIRSRKLRNIRQIGGDAKLDRNGMLRVNYEGELLSYGVLKGEVSCSDVLHFKQSSGHVLFSGEPRTPFRFSIIVKEKRTRLTSRNVRSELMKLLDSLTSKLLFKLTPEPHVCWFRGKDGVSCAGVLCANHIVSKARSQFRLRWDLQNLKIGCEGHNLYYHVHENKLWELVEEYEPDLWAYLDEQRKLSGKGMGSESAMKTLKIDLERKLLLKSTEFENYLGD